MRQMAVPPEPFAVSAAFWRRGSLRAGVNVSDCLILSSLMAGQFATGAMLSICTDTLR